MPRALPPHGAARWVQVVRSGCLAFSSQRRGEGWQMSPGCCRCLYRRATSKRFQQMSTKSGDPVRPVVRPRLTDQGWWGRAEVSGGQKCLDPPDSVPSSEGLRDLPGTLQGVMWGHPGVPQTWASGTSMSPQARTSCPISISMSSGRGTQPP